MKGENLRIDIAPTLHSMIMDTKIHLDIKMNVGYYFRWKRIQTALKRMRIDFMISLSLDISSKRNHILLLSLRKAQAEKNS